MTSHELALQMAEATKGYVARALAPIFEAIKSFEQSLASIPAGPKGDAGIPGKDADPAVIENMIDTKLAIAVSTIPVIRGERGKDGTDGENGIGEKGEPGRDAVDIDVIPALDPSKKYARGTFAFYRGGMIQAARMTDPITDGLESAGWKVCMNGIAEESEEVLDEGRVLKRTTTYTSGKTFERELLTAMMIDRGVWKEGEYEQGDTVSWDGSGWVAQCTTMQEPGNGTKDWRLAIKRGRDGRSFDDQSQQKREPVRLK